MEILYSARRCEHSHDGIKILDFTPGARNLAIFFTRTVAALNFVSNTDSRRYRRIQREIKLIVNGYLASAADYQRLGKSCALDMETIYRSGDEHFSIVWHACLLIHEATHGYMHRKQIAYTKRTRRRIEFICDEEMVRFVKRIRDPAFDWECIIREISANHLSTMDETKPFLKKFKQLVCRVLFNDRAGSN